MIWTEEESQKLAKLWLEGIALRALAREFGKSPGAIAGRLKRLNLFGVQRPGSQSGFKSSEANLDEVGAPVPQSVSQASPRLTAAPVSSAAIKAVYASKPNQCLYPIGDLRSSDFHFCGAPTFGGHYCNQHAAIVYVKPREAVKALAK